MSLYNIANKNLTALTPTTFAAEGLQERHDLQEALKGCIDAIAPDCLVISFLCALKSANQHFYAHRIVLKSCNLKGKTKNSVC
ncbi:hypothetical protein MHN79_10740 [Vibrio sp. Of14-4]|uniref:hypothetical protein n=1 Tax=Vibrio sp. Of14-4 TaxID=2724878 RepID=UPI001EF26C15|nr:hypothetical protein [Vibrio sp. Of14-4]MCG7489967.1 hypothetical protein [Vibrio sp. Of14-4]